MQDRLRMWVLGTAFIATSALVHFLSMAAWLNLLLFAGMLVWVRVLIGLVALAGGRYNLRQYVLSRGEFCRITAPRARRRIFKRLRELSGKREFYTACPCALQRTPQEILSDPPMRCIYSHWKRRPL